MLPRGFLEIQISRQFSSISSAQNSLDRLSKNREEEEERENEQH